MTPAEQEQLFTRFYRTRQATEEAIQGTGLGLTIPITKAIIEAHGGTITVTSNTGSGNGTTFAIELTTAAPALKLAS